MCVWMQYNYNRTLSASDISIVIFLILFSEPSVKLHCDERDSYRLVGRILDFFLKKVNKGLDHCE